MVWVEQDIAGLRRLTTLACLQSRGDELLLYRPWAPMGLHIFRVVLHNQKVLEAAIIVRRRVLVVSLTGSTAISFFVTKGKNLAIVITYSTALWARLAVDCM
jgi:hypothetical protein